MLISILSIVRGWATRSQLAAFGCAAALFVTCGTMMISELLAVPKPAPGKPAPSDPVSDRENLYLASLHRNTVEIFLDRPRFGVRRILPMWMNEVVLPPKPDAEPKKAEGPVELKKEEKDKDAHFTFQDAIRKHHRGFPAAEEGTWQLQKVELVGLIKHAKPVVYDTDKVPGMKEAKEVPTRDLDAFEKAALEDLRNGEKMKVERHGNEIRAMGPIFAAKRCAACHEKTCQLLGGFSYTLQLTLPVKPNRP